MDEFEKIYREYFTDVYRYLLKLTHNASDAEEIAAETFFRAMNAMHTFRSQSSLRSWLCAIAKNIFLDKARQNSRYADISDTGILRIPDPRPDPHQQAEKQELISQINRILQNLKEPYKTVFILRFIKDMSYRTIAGKYGKSENWACVTCHRAKEMIRKELKAYEE